MPDPTASEINPTLQRARHYLQGKIAGLVGCPVHEYDRRIDTEGTLRTLMSADDAAGDTAIHGYCLTVESDAAQSAYGGQGEPDNIYERIYYFVIRGYRSLNDGAASELTHQDEIETILTSLDTDPTLGGFADRTEPAECRVRNEIRQYGNHLVHSCEIVLPVVLRKDRIA